MKNKMTLYYDTNYNNNYFLKLKYFKISSKDSFVRSAVISDSFINI